MKSGLYTIVILLIFTACKKDKGLEHDLSLIYSQPIKIEYDRMQLWSEDVDSFLTECPDTHIKLIIYSDSLICSSCRLKKMEQWNQFFSRLKEYKRGISVCLIFYPASINVNAVLLALETHRPICPVYIDTVGIFHQSNPHLTGNPLLHTFTLDSENNVCLVGNPMENAQIEKLFWDIVNKNFKDGASVQDDCE